MEERKSQMFVFCNDNTCKKNYEGVCLLEALHIKVTDGVREDGTRGPLNACTNYEDRREEDAD
jgi:hypothetical protein